MALAKGSGTAAVETVEAEHRALERLLASHMEALIGFEFASALAALEEFARRLRRHFRLEEEELLPRASRLGGSSAAAQVKIILEEHGKLGGRLDEILSSLRGTRVDSVARSEVLDILKREFRFAAMLEHHVLREDRFLLPILRDSAGKEEAGER